MVRRLTDNRTCFGCQTARLDLPAKPWACLCLNARRAALGYSKPGCSATSPVLPADSNDWLASLPCRAQSQLDHAGACMSLPQSPVSCAVFCCLPWSDAIVKSARPRRHPARLARIPKRAKRSGLPVTTSCSWCLSTTRELGEPAQTLIMSRPSWRCSLGKAYRSWATPGPQRA